MRRLQKFVRLTAAAAFLFTAGAVQAEWPEKPIKLIVPFKAGGSSDQMGRVVQAGIRESEALAHPVTIVNVGGHYSIGSRRVMESKPDGYTFLLIHLALMGGQGSGALDFGWKDFEPVASVGEFCLMPMVRKDSGIDSLDQLMSQASEQPDTLIFGANLGAINHMGGLMLQQTTPGAKFRFVQIGGGTANYTALTGAQTDVTVLSGAEVTKFTRLPDGSENPDAQIRPLAYTGSERFAGLPDIATTEELGYDMNFCIKSWFFAPEGTPQEAIDGFASAIEKATGTDTYQDYLVKNGFANGIVTGEAMQQELAQTWERIEPIARMAAQK